MARECVEERSSMPKQRHIASPAVAPSHALAFAVNPITAPTRP
jgi:hypothetical protein